MKEHQKPRLILSSPNFFLYLTKEGEYYDKWMGFWKHGYKLLDYLAIKIGDKWLNASTFLSFEKKNSRQLVMHYKHATVTYELSSFGLKVKINANQPVYVELGVNIRKKEENYHLRTYNIKSNELRDALIISDTENRVLVIKGMTLEKAFYKDHAPFPFEKQRCYVLIGKGEKELMFSDSLDNLDMLLSRHHDQDLDDYALLLTKLTGSLHMHPRSSQTDYVKKLKNAWFWAVDSLLSLKKQDYYVAGIPWFDEFWARDALWAGFALLALDQKHDLRNLLTFLSSRINEKNHMLTLLSPAGNASYHGDDILPLYLILAKYYLLRYKDKELENKVKEVLKKAEAYLKAHTFNGLVLHRSTGTWMDTIAKEWIALDIQALWTKAAKCWKNESKKMRLYYEILLKGLIRFYRNGKWYRFLDPGSEEVAIKDTANMFLLTFFDLVHGTYKQAVLERGKVLLSKHGIALENPENFTFDPKGYHNGAVWFLVNGWALTSYLQNSYEKESKILLEAFMQDVKKFAYGNYSEVISWDKGELLGASHQLWSAAMFIISLTYGMQGIVLSEGFKLVYPYMLESLAYHYSSFLADHCIEGDEIRIHTSMPSKCESCYVHGKEMIFKREVVLNDIARKG